MINLVPDKAQVFREAFRVLKPGGRLAISDVVNTTPLSLELQADPALLCGCIAGAAPVERIETWLAQAGFADVPGDAKTGKPRAGRKLGARPRHRELRGLRDDRSAQARGRRGPSLAKLKEVSEAACCAPTCCEPEAIQVAPQPAASSACCAR